MNDTSPSRVSPPSRWLLMTLILRPRATTGSDMVKAPKNPGLVSVRYPPRA